MLKIPCAPGAWGIGVRSGSPGTGSRAGEHPERETGRVAHGSPRGSGSLSTVGTPTPETQVGSGGPGSRDVSAPAQLPTGACAAPPACRDSSPLRKELVAGNPALGVVRGAWVRPVASACYPPVPILEAESGPPGMLTWTEGCRASQGLGAGRADAEQRGDPALPPPSTHCSGSCPPSP